MSSESGPNVGHRVLRAAGMLLVAAWAVATAMQFITSVWVELVVVGSVIISGVTALFWRRSRL